MAPKLTPTDEDCIWHLHNLATPNIVGVSTNKLQNTKMTESPIALVAALILLTAMSANVPVARLPDNSDSSGMAGARLSDLAHGARA